MRVLVTGGLGRIGKVVVERLAAEHEVDILDVAEGPEGKRCFVGNVSDPAAVAEAMAGQDAVVHLAALYRYYPERHAEFVEVNYKGTFNVLEAAVKQGVGKVVYASSICAYGFLNYHEKLVPSYLPVDEGHPKTPSDLYGLTKLQSEQLCQAYAPRYGLRAVSLRLATVWFPDQLENTRRFYSWLAAPEQGANYLWNYVDVRDVAQAVALGLSYEGGPHEAFNVGADDAVADVPTRDLVRRFYPEVAELRNTDGFLTRERPPLYAIARAKEVLGYRPQHGWRDYARFYEA